MNLERSEQKLLAACNRHGLLPGTFNTYRGYLRRYVAALSQGRCQDLQTFLDHLATERKVSPSTIKQAVCALVFYIRHVQGKDPGRLLFPKAKGGRRAPTCLSLAEAHLVFQRMTGLPLLQASLMLGAGLRVRECLQLRLKDLDFSNHTIAVHGGKGDKDRTVPMPRALLASLEDRVQRCLLRHHDDRRGGVICPVPQESLRRKLGEATFGRAAWYWLFPSAAVRGNERWHATDRAVARQLREAAELAGILKRVSPHVMRHSFATAMLRNGTDIRTLQDLLGHNDIRTTMRYLHVEAAGLVTTPLDQEPSLEKVITFPTIAA